MADRERISTTKTGHMKDRRAISNRHEIDTLLSRLIEKDKSPSVQYLLFDKQRIIHKFQQGFADIKNEIKADDQTTYCAFSVTKTFTALAILQLAEKRKFNIDEPAGRYLPDFPYPANITIRQLLAHSSGLPNNRYSECFHGIHPPAFSRRWSIDPREIQKNAIRRELYK